MSISHNVTGSQGPATILQFPSTRTRAGQACGEHIVSETYWMIVATAADGSRQTTKMRSPRFLSPGRAYALSEDARGVRSLLLYKFARQPAASGREHALRQYSA